MTNRQGLRFGGVGGRCRTVVGAAAFPAAAMLLGVGLILGPLSATEPASPVGSATRLLDDEALVAFESQIQQTLEQVRPATVGLGGGSGVVVSEDGIVLTVAHVANRPGRRLRVTFPDGRRTSAIVLGTCDDLDIAVAKITQPGPWPAVSISQVETPDDGSWLLKLGYPVSFQHGQAPAVRVGCLLRKMRDAFVSDCPIMGGDSGGPIFDLAGNLVGISSRCQDKINYNVHIPLTKYYEHWEALCSGRSHKQFHDGTLRPIRPDWEAGYGKNEVATVLPFPANLITSDYVARKVPANGRLSQRRGKSLPLGRQGDDYLAGLERAREAATRATVEVHADGILLARGTLLNDDHLSSERSYIATKATLLGRSPADRVFSIRFTDDNRNVEAQLLGTDTDSDLAVLTIEKRRPEPVATAVQQDDSSIAVAASVGDDAEQQVTSVEPTMPARPGTPVLSIGMNGQSFVGFVSAAPRSFAMRQPPLMMNRAMLGVSVAHHQDGVRVTSVVDKSGARRAGIEVGDVFRSVDGKQVRSADELVSVIAARNIGERLRIELTRGEESLNVEAQLGKFQASERRTRYDNWGGGPFSDRRFEIPHVLPHDMPLPPGDCGSPLVDHRGRVLGVNIARALRTTTYALPIEDVWQKIVRLQQ